MRHVVCGLAVLCASLTMLRDAITCAAESPANTAKIETLTPEQARKLAAGSKSKLLYLPALSALDAATATHLASFAGEVLDLRGLTTLEEDSAKSLAQFKGRKMNLSGLAKVDATTAKALAEIRVEELKLDGLTAIDADTAAALAKFTGCRLILNGLTSLDLGTAEALAAYEGHAEIPTVVLRQFVAAHPLSKDTALALQWLARRRQHRPLPFSRQTVLKFAEKRRGQLQGITAFEGPDAVAIAQTLARYEGPLRLPDLRRISPQALAALLDKEDIEIPDVGTLELVREPDGSSADDFAIPDQVRQELRRR